MASSVALILERGYLFHQKSQLPQAEMAYKQALKFDPNNFDALYLLGVLKIQTGSLSEAEDLLVSATMRNPNHIEAKLQLGSVLAQVSKIEEARNCFLAVQSIAPNNPIAYFNIGLTDVAKGDYKAAVGNFKIAVQFEPTYVDALNNLGIAYLKTGCAEDSIDTFYKVLALVPGYLNALLGVSSGLLELGRFAEAMTFIESLIIKLPSAYEGYNLKGLALAGLNETEKAEAAYQFALSINPSAYDVHSNLGILHAKCGNDSAALEAMMKSIAINSINPDAYRNLGDLYKKKHNYAESERCYHLSIQQNPLNADTYVALGLFYFELKDYDKSQVFYEKSLELKQNSPEAHRNLGNLFFNRGDFEQAARCYSNAMALNPDMDFLRADLFYAKMRQCDWTDFSTKVSDLILRIKANQRVASPLQMLSLSDSLEIQRNCASIYISHAETKSSPIPARLPLSKKIRVGYISSDFGEHPVTYLLTGLIESHNRNRFEVLGFDIGAKASSHSKERIKAAFDSFYDLSCLGDTEAVRVIIEKNLDVLVDLNGHTKGSRKGILSRKTAPLQINYIGYPGTMGANYIDYIVGDANLIPDSALTGYSEKVIFLPNSFQPNDSSRKVGQVLTRKAYGLEEGAFVFASFNQSAKINPEVYSAWLEILNRVPNSVLWLAYETDSQVANLNKIAEDNSVLPNRIVFANKVPYEDHLARYKMVDLVLDTMPFNGGTTTSDALWGGAPVITVRGQTFAGRMSESLLNAIDLPELVCESIDEYVSFAVYLAENPLKLQSIKQKLNQNRLTTPLFDTLSYTRNLEKAYENIVSRERQGLSPDHVRI
jgi:protein O-GlcNAc transferase